MKNKIMYKYYHEMTYQVKTLTTCEGSLMSPG